MRHALGIEAAATRGLKLIGRSTELAQTFSVLERSHAGHGEVIALVGEPAVGKSRLGVGIRPRLAASACVRASLPIGVRLRLRC